MLCVLPGITSAKLAYQDLASVKRSATFELDETISHDVNFLSDRISVIVILHMPDGRGTVEFLMGTFLLETPQRNIYGNKSTRSIGAYDESIILDGDRLTERFFIRAGTNYVGAILKILALTGINKINIERTDSALRSDREFAIGLTIREVVNTLLGEINYKSIYVDEDGFFRAEPYIEPALRPINHYYISDRDSIIVPEIVDELDISKQPNVFTRVARNLDDETELVATIINSNPSSATSTVSRGRHIVSYEEIENIANQSALTAYTRRIALNSMSTYSHLTFKTPLMPTHGSGDTIYFFDKTLMDVPQIYTETRWEMDLSFEGLMVHECRRSVML